ncbi:MAG: (d)CMP kinase [Patescibacteria group bacterium]
MIITISGLPGSGKSTVGKRLAKQLGYRFYSIGDLRGKMAMERGMSIAALNKLGESEAWTDQEVDEYQKKLAHTEDNFVIDGRLSWHFIPQSFKVFLTVDVEEGARRIFRKQRPDEPPVQSVEEMVTANRARIASDNTRYQKWYGIQFNDPKNYDVVIDTTRGGQKQVMKKILARLS